MPTAEPLQAQPTELRLSDAGRKLHVTWADERVCAFDAAWLRSHCRCSECTSAARAGRLCAVAPEIALADVIPYGPAAVNLHFSDGHRRGIFPFAYLATLSQEVQASGSLHSEL